MKSAIKSKTNVVTTSYVSPAIRELDVAIKQAGIVVLNEVGVDPGVDHLYAIKTIDEIHAKKGKVCTMPAVEVSFRSCYLAPGSQTGERILLVLWRVASAGIRRQSSWFQVLPVSPRCPVVPA